MIDQGETTKITEHIFANGEPILTAERQDSNLTLYFIHGDHLNSSSVMTKVNGEIEQVLDYYPFGNTRFNQQIQQNTQNKGEYYWRSDSKQELLKSNK